MRIVALPALLLLAATALSLLLPAADFSSPAAPRAIRAEALAHSAEAMKGLPPSCAAQAAAISSLAGELEGTKEEIAAERERLRALGRGMRVILDARQIRWIARHRDEISLNRFEKPYWDKLASGLAR